MALDQNFPNPHMIVSFHVSSSPQTPSANSPPLASTRKLHFNSAKLFIINATLWSTSTTYSALIDSGASGICHPHHPWLPLAMQCQFIDWRTMTMTFNAESSLRASISLKSRHAPSIKDEVDIDCSKTAKPNSMNQPILRDLKEEDSATDLSPNTPSTPNPNSKISAFPNLLPSQHVSSQPHKPPPALPDDDSPSLRWHAHPLPSVNFPLSIPWNKYKSSHCLKTPSQAMFDFY
ncbi:hypothetical protein C0995_009386 [Termitomyces sp. Mi166|nr:hypothetical protein C0995_009386 [Termitomyces sp. Mi166\